MGGETGTQMAGYPPNHMGMGGKGGKGDERWRHEALALADAHRRMPSPGQYVSTIHQHPPGQMFCDFYQAQPLYEERGSARFVDGASPRHSNANRATAAGKHQVRHDVT